MRPPSGVMSAYGRSASVQRTRLTRRGSPAPAPKRTTSCPFVVHSQTRPSGETILFGMPRRSSQENCQKNCGRPSSAVPSREAGELRRALWDASGETSTIVAAAAFRALADLAGFDPKINARRLDSRLVSCAGDASASSAARVMAVQLCGERGIAASRPLLQRIFADAATPVPLKKAAEWSLRALDGKVVAQ